jgi:hypothetical protein
MNNEHDKHIMTFLQGDFTKEEMEGTLLLAQEQDFGPILAMVEEKEGFLLGCSPYQFPQW